MTRRFVALVLFFVIAASFASVYIAWSRSQEALDRGVRTERRTEQNICRAVNNITYRDRLTIASGPRKSVPILRVLGFTKKQVREYLHSQYDANGRPRKGSVTAQEIKARPFLRCEHHALPTGPIKVPPTLTTSTAKKKG